MLNGKQQNGHAPRRGERTSGAQSLTGSSTTGLERENLIERVLELLYRGRWIALITFLLVFGAVALYTYSLPNIYEAQSLVMISKGRSSGGAQQQIYAAPRQPFTRGGGQSLANELLILRNSMKLARDVARRVQGLERVPNSGAALTVTKTGEDAGADSSSLEALTHRVRRRVSFGTAARETDAVRITATSTVPSEARLLANLYTEEYVQLTRDASRTSLSAKRDFLEDQQNQRQQELQSAEKELENYMRREDAISLTQQQSSLVSNLSNMQAERDAADLELEQKQKQLQRMKQRLRRIDSSLVERIASPVSAELQRAQRQRADKRAEKEQILLRNPGLDPNSDSLATINRKIAALDRQVKRLADEYVREGRASGTASMGRAEGGGATEGSANAGGAGSSGGGVGGNSLSGVIALENQIAQKRIEISGLHARMGVLRDRAQEYRAELNQIPGQSMKMAQLRRQRKYTEQMYQTVTSALQQTRIESQAELGYANVVRRAQPPGDPVRPNTVRNLIAGLLGGLFLGIGLALGRGAMDKHIYTPENLNDRGENVIGVVPDTSGMIEREYGGAEFVEQDDRRFATHLVALLAPLSAATESYRHLRTNIQFSFPDRDVETILVTGSSQGIGKTLTAANLAIVMAQTGRRTLLVDTDLRRPRIHKLLGMSREPGIVEHLFDKNGAEDVPKAAARETGVDNLYVSTAGAAVPNPAELLGSQSMEAFVEEAREHFDMVIFDTPPVLVVTDAALLAAQCDASVLVTRAAESKTYELDETKEALASVDASVIGVVLNGFEPKMTYNYDYRYRYYSDSYQYYGGEEALNEGDAPPAFR